jgi:hypothetical protein
LDPQQLRRRKEAVPQTPAAIAAVSCPNSIAFGGLVRDQKVNLLVPGAHGRSGISKLVPGSLAEEIFHRVSCPMLILQEPIGRENPANPNVLRFAPTSSF